MPDNPAGAPVPEPVLAALAARHLGTWAEQAACTGQDPEIFFPPRHTPAAKAKEICQRCPVRRECLDYAMRVGEKHGVWGGLDENERHTLRRGQRKSKSRKQGAA